MTPRTPSTAAPAAAGLGVPCPEAQADGVPCAELGTECSICGRAAPCPHVSDVPTPRRPGRTPPGSATRG
jgi:hypothetical protein